MNDQDRRRAEASLQQEKVKAMQALAAIAMNDQDRRRAEASLQQEKVKAMQALAAIAMRHVKIAVGRDLPNPIADRIERLLENRINAWEQDVLLAIELALEVDDWEQDAISTLEFAKEAKKAREEAVA